MGGLTELGFGVAPTNSGRERPTMTLVDRLVRVARPCKSSTIATSSVRLLAHVVLIRSKCPCSTPTAARSHPRRPDPFVPGRASAGRRATYVAGTSSTHTISTSSHESCTGSGKTHVISSFWDSCTSGIVST